MFAALVVTIALACSALVNADYVIRRNVKDYGAKGDGVTDDTEAIILAITQGRGDDSNAAYPTVYSSSTLTPAIVYFPSGTYLISKTLPLIYYTQMVGDPDNVPSIKVKSTSGADIRLIDSLSETWGGNLVNQNNFFHQVRNFVLDMSECDACTGIHWQVAQATQLSNIYFKMKSGSKCQGIWMENGSGGFVSDLVFSGGMYGMWVGNQQFTSRNMTFSDHSLAAIYLNWDWGWTFKSLSISNTPVGIDVGGSTGTLVVLDSKFSNVTTSAVRTTFTSSTSSLRNANNLVLENVQLDATAQGSSSVVLMNSVTPVLSISSKKEVIPAYVQGRVWSKGVSQIESLDLTASGSQLVRPSSLLYTSANLPSNYVSNSYFEASRPLFDSAKRFTQLNVVTDCAVKNDGVTDVTSALQSALEKAASQGAVLFFPHGTYLISDTITVPKGSRLLGEAWSVIMAVDTNNKFSDPSNPLAVIKVGNEGDVGTAQLVDLLITTKGALPGGKLVEWNIAAPENDPAAAGMWETHFRVGGAIGTKIDPTNCPRGDGGSAAASSCFGAWALMHVTKSATIYMENVWGWVADHDLDYDDQINVYNARGLLMESTKGAWLYGTAFEHSLLYQYNFNAAQNVFMGMIQTETPYFQPAPLTPFLDNTNSYSSVLTRHSTDPSYCTSDSRCNMAYAVVVQNQSEDILLYGAGLYSFFNLWDQGCLYSGTDVAPTCQLNLNYFASDSHIYTYNFNTYGSVYMITSDEASYATAASNMNTFCSSAVVNLIDK